jgi:hypothetical protein
MTRRTFFLRDMLQMGDEKDLNNRRNTGVFAIISTFYLID